jgi:hypothetical protein
MKNKENYTWYASDKIGRLYVLRNQDSYEKAVAETMMKFGDTYKTLKFPDFWIKENDITIHPYM